MKFTNLDLAFWIMNNRQKGAFKDYTIDDIIKEVLQSIEERVFLYHVNSDTGSLDGVVTGYRDDNAVFIKNILATSKGVVKDFMQCFLNMHPGCMITGECRGRKRTFNDPQKLARRI